MDAQLRATLSKNLGYCNLQAQQTASKSPCSDSALNQIHFSCDNDTFSKSLWQQIKIFLSGLCSLCSLKLKLMKSFLRSRFKRAHFCEPNNSSHALKIFQRDLYQHPTQFSFRNWISSRKFHYASSSWFFIHSFICVIGQFNKAGNANNKSLTAVNSVVRLRSTSGNANIFTFLETKKGKQKLHNNRTKHGNELNCTHTGKRRKALRELCV